MQPRHDGPDRDVEDLRRVRVGEVADVDQDDHVAEVVRHLRRARRTIAVLRQPLVDALLVGDRPPGLLELVDEEVVALLERLHVRRALQPAAAVDVEVREDAEEPGAQVRPGWY